ncbi:hypothetical protein EJB05_16015 [Eragrostis curvula]|uniref:Uncharacterized protein n=1 Tax=Eragrostis curvula TaxID=38414 RepID=A0A5J9VFN6_9POAL|nr:hypothetical protein EJB05_16015 [Eragrostis curvula]
MPRPVFTPFVVHQLRLVVLLQKRGRPPRPQEEDHARGDFKDEAQGLAPPQSKRKRAISRMVNLAIGGFTACPMVCGTKHEFYPDYLHESDVEDVVMSLVILLEKYPLLSCSVKRTMIFHL